MGKSRGNVVDIVERLVLAATIVSGRYKKDLTQEALAQELGVSRPTLVKWEQGVSVPSFTMAQAVSVALDIDISFVSETASRIIKHNRESNEKVKMV